jgi:hypothetical protein
MYDSTVEHNYSVLCELYSVYTSIVSSICSKNSSVDDSLCIDDILRKIESYPITWKFYAQQSFKFSQDFEDLIIFKDDSHINKNG